MEKIMREKIIETIERERLIVIVRGVAREKLVPLAQAMYAGGIRLLEITFSSNHKISDEDTAENIRILAEEFKGKMYIGAGTVLTEKQVQLTKDAGGGFIISPDTCENVIKKTRELGLVSIPGALTPSEFQTAHKLGADFVKIFPITSLGTEYVKAVRGPLDHIKFLAVGGVDKNNMQDYLKVGVCGFGVGSNIIDKTALMNNDWKAIERLAKEYVEGLK